VIKDDDLVVGTHGRSFYILDDITPVRQAAALVAAPDLHLFAQAFPQRFFQMGMAEQLLMAAAGGMAKEGLLPFATTYAVFGTRRAYDFLHQVIAEENLNVKRFCAAPARTNDSGDGATASTSPRTTGAPSGSTSIRSRF